jgi:hypothetical protein
MRSSFGKSLLLGIAIATVSLAGCGNAAKEETSAGVAENSGTVGLALQVVPGAIINSIVYSITGNGVSLSGTLDVSGSTSSQIVIGGIPAGTGYVISLTANSVDGGLTCSGSSTFDVKAGTTTSVSPHLQCRKGKIGGVGVTPVVNVCPSVDSITAPAHDVVGTAVAVSAAASDLDNGPSTLTYAWTATSGSFSSTTIAAPTFTCAAAGTATLRVTVSDSDCTDTASVDVICDAPPPPVTTTSLLSGKSAACLSCAQLNGCLQPACEGVAGSAASGTTRSKLCLDTLTCVLTSKCASGGVGTPCYCGTAAGAACLTAGAANGACKSQEELGLETTDPAAIATGFGDTTKGGGAANTLVQCLNDSACTSCF